MVHHLREQEKKDDALLACVVERKEKNTRRIRKVLRAAADASWLLLVDAVIWPTQTMQ